MLFRSQAEVFELSASGEMVKISAPVWQTDTVHAEIAPTGPVMMQDLRIDLPHTAKPQIVASDISTLRPNPLRPSSLRIAASVAVPGANPAYGGGDVRQMIAYAARRYGVDPALLDALAWQESRYNHNARSHAGAIGVMQLMPGTARNLGVSDPTNLSQNVLGGAAYLRMQLEEFGNNVPLALAAYNAGPGAVKKHGGIPPYRETQDYVRKILHRLETVQQQDGL